MELHATISRWRRGQLAGSDGKTFIREADRWMADQGIVDGERLMDVVAPGEWIPVKNP